MIKIELMSEDRILEIKKKYHTRRAAGETFTQHWHSPRDLIHIGRHKVSDHDFMPAVSAHGGYGEWRVPGIDGKQHFAVVDGGFTYEWSE